MSYSMFKSTCSDLKIKRFNLRPNCSPKHKKPKEFVTLGNGHVNGIINKYVVIYVQCINFFLCYDIPYTQSIN